MLVLKKINNNVAVCKDGNQRELIAFGKGIGFQATPYELTDLRKVERTFYDVPPQYISLLSDIPYEVVQFTARHLLEIQDELPYETNASLALTLADHIAFVIERSKKGIYVRMPSIYELELNYPLEVKIGRYFVSAVKREFKVRLPKSEIQGIAMHFINARDRLRIENVPCIEQHFEEILQKTTKIIEQEFHIRVRQDTFNYSRFAMHLQYLLNRAFEQKPIDSSNLQMYQSACDEFPDIAHCVDRICDYYDRTWKFNLSEEERLYLIMHVNRVCAK
ncbi:MAG: PRD domain-containing protein [Eubacteriales bacterium]|nr:PRD domain-containing protein [Eubacteriales bacterium]